MAEDRRQRKPKLFVIDYWLFYLVVKCRVRLNQMGQVSVEMNRSFGTVVLDPPDATLFFFAIRKVIDER
jgi:hypothetical protein